MELAALEVYHSRPIAPTRRVALGHANLPVSPAPGFGGILLGGIVAKHWAEVPDDTVESFNRLTLQLQEGVSVVQPRLRHRFQTDRHGLLRSRHRLVGHGDHMRLDLDSKGSAVQQVLGAIYAAGQLERTPRALVMDAVRKAMRWTGGSDDALFAHLAGRYASRDLVSAVMGDPVHWALDVLGLADANGDTSDRLERSIIKRRFRDLLREAHPDHGGATVDAAQRIADLTEARRILLAP